eukprot:TRINITY_DN61969_c0_g1_i1.p1 TRINITY_DN61969_c0_g1~~TRINITY_DN61969_c0_g1_i1.p1  ORF type:complete len:600 (-),score=95.01 TRINITY_DN61969_c0_g1_i1:35-1834(-)
MALQLLFAALLAVQCATGQRAASCKQPFVDASGGKAYWWMCAKDCPGGMAWSDIGCCCACQRPTALESYRARCGLPETTTTTEGLGQSSSTTSVAAGSYLRPEEAAVAGGLPLGHSWSGTTAKPPFLVRSEAAAAAVEAALADNATAEEVLVVAFNASRAAGATLLEIASIVASTATSLPEPEDTSDTSARSIEELARLVASSITAAIGHDKDGPRIAALAATQISFDGHMSVEFTMQLAETVAQAAGASPDDVARIMASLPEDVAIMSQKRAAATTRAPVTTSEQPPSFSAPPSLTVDPGRLLNRRQIALEGDFASVGTNTKKFLIECTVALSPVLCLKVAPGSIILTVSAASPELVDAALSHVAEGGLDLPSFGVLRPSSSTSESAPPAGNSSQNSLAVAAPKPAVSTETSSSLAGSQLPSRSSGVDASFLTGSVPVAEEPQNGFDVWFALLTTAIAALGATAAGVWLYMRHRDRSRPMVEDFEVKPDASDSTSPVAPNVPTFQDAKSGLTATPPPPKSYRTGKQSSPFPAQTPWILGANGFVAPPMFMGPPGVTAAAPPPPNYPHPFQPSPFMQPSPFIQPQSQPFPVSPCMHGGP